MPWHLTTSEWLDEVKRVLKPGGLYALNVIDLEPLEFLKAELATFSDAFAEVQLLTSAKERRTWSVAGSVQPMPRLVQPRAARSEGVTALPSLRDWMSFVGGAEALRDDFAPVDQLRTIGG